MSVDIKVEEGNVTILFLFLSEWSNKTIKEEVSSSISFVWSRDIGFPFSFQGNRPFGAITGWNEAEQFDALNVKRGPKPSFWDRIEYFWIAFFWLLA